jgi:hypothetical protein
MKVRNVVRNQFDGARTGLLFSSGLDSLTSYVRHKLPERVEVPIPVELSHQEFTGVSGEVMALESAAMERWRKGDPWDFIEISKLSLEKKGYRVKKEGTVNLSGTSSSKIIRSRETPQFST